MALSGFIVTIILAALVFVLLLYGVIKLIWGNIQRKSFVDVDIYNVCGGTIERESFNCIRKKKTIGTNNIYVLGPWNNNSYEFEYLQDFVFVRTQDRKRCVSFLNVRGTLIPFIPGHEIETKKIEKDGVVTKTVSKYTSKVDSTKYTPEIMKRRHEEIMKEGYDKYKDLGRTTGGLRWQLIVAGVLVVLVVVYLVWKYAGGG